MGQQYTGWGKDNRFPYHLYSVYRSCVPLQTIINGSIGYTVENGISFDNIPDHLLGENGKGETLAETVSRLVADRWIFGGFACKASFDETGDIAAVEYLDIRHVRTNREGSVIYYKDFTAGPKNNKMKRYPSFGSDEPAPEKVFYYKGTRTRGCYPVPDYAAALLSAEIQAGIQEFHYNYLIHHFSTGRVIHLNNTDGMDDRVREEVERKIMDKYTGPGNAGTLMVAFNGHADNALAVESIPEDTEDTKYQALERAVSANIFTAMRARPLLFGLDTGTDVYEQEFNEVYPLYHRTVIVPIQNELARVIKKIFPEGNIQFSPFNLMNE